MTSCIYAQDKADVKQQAPDPAAAVPQPKVIFDFKDELKLTNEQVEGLKKILSHFQEFITEKRDRFNVYQGELNGMIQKKEDLKLIKAKLEQLSKLQIEISYTDIETSRKIESVLKSSQLEKWKALQEQARQQAQQQAQQRAQ